jgi:hypothetical protein
MVPKERTVVRSIFSIKDGYGRKFLRSPKKWMKLSWQIYTKISESSLKQNTFLSRNQNGDLDLLLVADGHWFSWHQRASWADTIPSATMGKFEYLGRRCFEH